MSSKVKVYVCERGLKRGCSKSCGALGSPDLRAACESWLQDEGFLDEVKVVAASCLGFCKKGIATEIHEPRQGKKRWALGQHPDDFEKLKNKILKALGYDKATRRFILGSAERPQELS
jgi:hypothetical protein